MALLARTVYAQKEILFFSFEHQRKTFWFRSLNLFFMFLFGSPLFPAHRGIGHRSRRRSVLRPSSGALAAAQVGECAEQAQGGAHCRVAHAARMEGVFSFLYF